MLISFNLRALRSTCSLCFQSRSLKTTVRDWLGSFPCLCFRSTQWALSMSMSIPTLVLSASFNFSSASSQVLREDSRIPLTLMLLRRLWLSIYSSENDWNDRSELSRLISLLVLINSAWTGFSYSVFFCVNSKLVFIYFADFTTSSNLIESDYTTDSKRVFNIDSCTFNSSRTCAILTNSSSSATKTR